MDTYEDTLLSSGHIGGWPGMHPAGSRVVRNEYDDVVDVLPPRSEEALPPTQMEAVAEEAPTASIQPESEATA